MNVVQPVLLPYFLEILKLRSVRIWNTSSAVDLGVIECFGHLTLDTLFQGWPHVE